MVQPDQNVKVFVNGELQYNESVKADTDFMLDNYFTNRDSELLYINKIDIDL